MEELRPEELEELLEELQEETEEEEAPSPEVETLIHDLQPARGFMLRLLAARQLGKISESNHQVVQVLLAAAETDDTAQVRAAAAESLRAPVHQEYLRQHPEVAASMRHAVDQIDSKGEAGRARAEQRASLIRCLGVSAVAGLAVGLVIALWDAGQLRLQDGGLACGTGLLVAFVVGAVVGVIVGAVVQGREDLVRGSVMGAVSAGVVAAVSWLPITVILIVMSGGP